MTDATVIARVKQGFVNTYGDSADPVFLATAPGRLNIIGEHTDYNEGFVFPCGLDAHMYLAFRVRSDSKVNVFAMDLNEKGTCDVKSIDIRRDKQVLPRFLHYVAGPSFNLAKYMPKGKALCGFDGVITSTIPNGGGVSSSSALCVAAALAIRKANEKDLVKLTPQEFLMCICEGEWIWSGVRGGIMDQFTSLNAKAGHAFVLDCRTGGIDARFGQLQLPSNLTLVVADTRVKHELVGTPYNDRRAACERAAVAIQKTFPDRRVTHLRDATEQMLQKSKGAMDAEAFKRASHVVREDVRTIACAKALKDGDLKQAGTLVNESHEDLSQVYEVSCKELDAMVELARKCKGVYGARMMGGGFGGCCIILADPKCTKDIIAKLTTDYKAQIQITPRIFASKPGSGASLRCLGHIHPHPAMLVGEHHPGSIREAKL